MISRLSNSLSPIYSLACGYTFISIMLSSLYLFGFYGKSVYFSWGVPITFFGSVIYSKTLFYALLIFVFVHQLITNWIMEVVIPWIFNSIQNPENKSLRYSKGISIAIINFNALYQQIHTALIISGITSQISFLVVLILADFITLTYVNWQYIKIKEYKSEVEMIV